MYRYGVLFLVILMTACSAQTPLPTVTPTRTDPAPTPTVTPLLPAPTPTPVYYVVQVGDTLSSIAVQFGVPVEALQEANGIDDPNLIQSGQRLLIPGPTPIPTVTLPPTLTPTPNIPPQLAIVEVLGRGAPGSEAVIIVNQGRAVLLQNWTLRDAQGNAFVFPYLYLASGAKVYVHTGSGENTPLHLYWNRETAVWEEQGETAILADERGVIYASKSLD